MNPAFARIVEQLRARRLADLTGTRIGASIPISERLLSEVVVAALPPASPVRTLTIHPQSGNRLTVRAKLPHVDFLPPVSLTLVIEQQPMLPDTPLVFRLLSLPGLLATLGPSLPLARMLPPGVRLEKDRIFVDITTLAERHGYGDLLPHLSGLRIATDEGRLIVELDVKVVSG